MEIAPLKKLSTRIFTPLIIIFTIVLVLLTMFVPNVTRESAVSTAITSAESTVKQYKAIRSYYTKNVVSKVISSTNLGGNYDHATNPDNIPLPATFIMDMSAILSDQDIVTLKLYSPYPFPNRANRTVDSFGKKAWDALSKDSSQTFTSVEEIDGKPMVRVALADTMTQPGCVSCHNTRADTPKDDWKLNELRGVLEVQVPIEQAIESAAGLNRTVATIVVVALTATVLLLYTMFSRLITTRLRTVRGALQDIADGDGDLSQRLNETPEDEIGAIASSFNHFMEQLEGSMRGISAEVEQLVNTANTMEEITSQEREQVANQQAETDQVASAMNEMTATSQEMARMASTTAEQSQATQQQSDSGRQIVADNKHSVEELSRNIQKASEAVTRLEQDSQNIGGVLDVIRGIAEQTNLLALNAAIEAARAGEQGRGFAVVADEVRTLASKTQESTEEIQHMIEQLQSGSKAAVQTISQGNSSIEVSLEKANQTNEMIDVIGNAISSIQELNLQIATAAEEQTSVSEEINLNISNIAEASSVNNDNSQRLLDVASNINSTVHNINAELRRFTR